LFVLSFKIEELAKRGFYLLLTRCFVIDRFILVKNTETSGVKYGQHVSCL